MSARVKLRNDGDQAVTIAASAHPVPRTVEPGGVVEVDGSAVGSLTGDVFSRASTTRPKVKRPKGITPTAPAADANTEETR